MPPARTFSFPPPPYPTPPPPYPKSTWSIALTVLEESELEVLPEGRPDLLLCCSAPWTVCLGLLTGGFLFFFFLNIIFFFSLLFKSRGDVGCLAPLGRQRVQFKLGRSLSCLADAQTPKLVLFFFVLAQMSLFN